MRDCRAVVQYLVTVYPARGRTCDGVSDDRARRVVCSVQAQAAAAAAHQHGRSAALQLAQRRQRQVLLAAAVPQEQEHFVVRQRGQQRTGARLLPNHTLSIRSKQTMTVRPGNS